MAHRSGEGAEIRPLSVTLALPPEVGFDRGAHQAGRGRAGNSIPSSSWCAPYLLACGE